MFPDEPRRGDGLAKSPHSSRARTSATSRARPPQKQLAAFLAKFDPQVALVARSALARMQKLLPGATRLVYDNYNALAIGFGPSDRTSEAVFSIAVFPRWVSLFFFHGVELPDPDGALKGSGKHVRHIVLRTADDLDRTEVRALIREALARADPPIPRRPGAPLVIKSVSPVQRARRPRITPSASPRRR